MNLSLNHHYHEIRELDILCSKDKSLANHPGNRLFREIVEDSKSSYLKAADKATKMKTTRHILNCIRNDHGSRLLKFDPDLAQWVELSYMEARDKVGHALRYAIKRSGKEKNKKTLSKGGSTAAPQASRSIYASSLDAKKLESFDTPSHTSFPRERSSIKDLAAAISTAAAAAMNSVSPNKAGKSGSSFSKERKNLRASFTTTDRRVHGANLSLSISMEKIQSARQNIDQLFKQLNVEMATSMPPTTDALPATVPHVDLSSNNNISNKEILPDYSQPLLLVDDPLHDYLSSKDLKFIMDEMDEL